MRVWGSSEVLTQSEVNTIYEKALKVLEEIGVRVENEWMVDRLSSHGAIVNDKFVITFPGYVIDEMVRTSVPFNWDAVPKITFYAGANPQFYMAAGKDEVIENTVQSIERLTKLAGRLDNITHVGLMGVASDVPSALTPLYVRLFGWKHAPLKSVCDEIWDNRTFKYVKEMIDAYSDDIRMPDNSSLKNLIVYMISPLCLRKEEASRFEEGFKNGFHVDVGALCSAGGTAPATLAGSLVQSLAEKLFANFIERIFYNNKSLTLNTGISIMDMKYGFFPYGRPEIGLTNLAMGQIARSLKAEFVSNSFSAEAKLPSSEAGMQKSLSAITGIIAGTTAFHTVGLLSVDEIISEEQLVIDNEYAGALLRLAKGFEITEETMAFDVIKEVGLGGTFIDTEHTFLNFRSEHWQPELFSRELLDKWNNEGRKTDREKATLKVEKILKEEKEFGISPGCEKNLLNIIDRAKMLF